MVSSSAVAAIAACMVLLSTSSSGILAADVASQDPAPLVLQAEHQSVPDMLAKGGTQAFVYNPTLLTGSQQQKAVKTFGTAGSSSSRMANQFPALAGFGIAQTLFTLAPCAQRAPHTHPRGSGLLYAISGVALACVTYIRLTNRLFLDLSTGWLSLVAQLQGTDYHRMVCSNDPVSSAPIPHVSRNSSSRLMRPLLSFGTQSAIRTTALEVGFALEDASGAVINNVTTGASALFPLGLLHYQQNRDCRESAVYTISYNADDPGTVNQAQALFALPAETVAGALNATTQQAEGLKASIPTKNIYPGAIGTSTSCVAACMAQGIVVPSMDSADSSEPLTTAASDAVLTKKSNSSANDASALRSIYPIVTALAAAAAINILP